MFFRLSFMVLLSTLLMLFGLPAFGQLPRPPIITESLFSPSVELVSQSRGSRYRSSRDDFAFTVWQRNLLALGVPDSIARPGHYCRYDTALQILVEMRKSERVSDAYQREWAANQQTVLDACQFGRSTAGQRLAPYLANSPARADGDYTYQFATLNFYQRNYELALTNYEYLAEDRASAMRPRAAYMVVRTLRALGRRVEAYDLIESILSDPSLADIHEISHNYRFVIGYRNSGAVADDHLDWLLELVRTSPERSQDPVSAINDSLDASYQLNSYFPLADRESGAIDWWLNDNPPETPKMRAVFELSRSDELVDWLQAKWALNVLQTDWLWSLHELDSYWGQNSRIVQHALGRWNAGDGLHWLQVVADRVHPQDDSAQQVLNSYDELLELANRQDESSDFKHLIADLWLQTIRIHLGREEYQQAMDKAFAFPLAADSSDFRALWRNLETGNRSFLPNRAGDAAAFLVLRWLIYIGEQEEARRFLDTFIANTSERRKLRIGNMTHWYRALLARDWSEVVANFMPVSGVRSSITNYESAIVNLLPAAELAKLAEYGENFTADQQGTLARTAFTRAVLLQDQENAIALGNSAAFYNPEIRDEILAVVNSRDFSRATDLFLKYPRFRITPNFVMGWRSRYGSQRLLAHEIDTWNHNDNNWWCQYDRDYLVERLYTAFRISPRPVRRLRITGGRIVSDVMLNYQSQQDQFLSQHPVFDRVNVEEERALTETGSGPKYLSAQVIARDAGMRWRFWQRDNKDRQAQALYLAVKSTRYGCNRNGPHGEYSRAAFMTLHDNYPDSHWVERTPYWFN